MKDSTFCSDTIQNGYLSFVDNFTIERISHINTNDAGTLAFAEIKKGSVQQSRIVKLNKADIIDWSIDFSWEVPGYRLSAQQAAASTENTYYAGVVHRQDNTEAAQLFVVQKFGSTLFGVKKCF